MSALSRWLGCSAAGSGDTIGAVFSRDEDADSNVEPVVPYAGVFGSGCGS